MAQFAVYRNSNPATRRRFPLLLDVQSDLLDDLATRVVVPLAPAESRKAGGIGRLTPLVVVGKQYYRVVMPQLAGVPGKALGPAVGDLQGERDAIIAALDLLLTGI